MPVGPQMPFPPGIDPGDIIPRGFHGETQQVPPRDLPYRMAQKQEGRTTTHVVGCPLCTHDDDGWNMRFIDGKLTLVEFRTKAEAEACINRHLAGDHTWREREDTTSGE